jgi:ADP-ribose pyrophosphatase YjhB (NUDIX family)
MNDTNVVDKKHKIKELEDLAREVLNLKIDREQRRPLLIEFCGSPKSGKSTTINSLNIFLKRNGFRTVVLTERASICPVANKTHPFFNIWTLTAAISEIIKNLDQGKDKVDIIISDRGIFDALCWFEWLNTNPSKLSPYLDDQSYDDLKHFIFMDIWSRYLDLIYVFKVKPETSIIREYANLLTEKRGSIMKEPILEGFNTATDNVIRKYQKRFREVTEIETDTDETNNDPNKVSYMVTKNLLTILKGLLIEKIGYFESDLTQSLKRGINKVDDIMKFPINYNNRDIVEKGNYIQPIPIAVITNPQRNKILMVKKSEKRTSSDSPERNKSLVYIGGHIRQEDEKNKNVFNTIERCLHREIQEEIGESLSVQESKPFLIFTPDSEKSKKHLAVCYVIEMDLEDKRFKLTSDEFIMKTGTSKSGHVLDINEIASGKYDLESWSLQILEHIFDKRMIEKRTPLFPDSD